MSTSRTWRCSEPSTRFSSTSPVASTIFLLHWILCFTMWWVLSTDRLSGESILIIFYENKNTKKGIIEQQTNCGAFLYLPILLILPIMPLMFTCSDFILCKLSPLHKSFRKEIISQQKLYFLFISEPRLRVYTTRMILPFSSSPPSTPPPPTSSPPATFTSRTCWRVDAVVDKVISVSTTPIISSWDRAERWEAVPWVTLPTLWWPHITTILVVTAQICPDRRVLAIAEEKYFRGEAFILQSQWFYQDIRLTTQQVVQNFTTWPCLWHIVQIFTTGPCLPCLWRQCWIRVTQQI